MTTPNEQAGIALPCPHGRLPIDGEPGYKHCPHCLGLNKPIEDIEKSVVQTTPSKADKRLKASIAYRLKNHHLPPSIFVSGDGTGDGTGNLDHCVESLAKLFTTTLTQQRDELLAQLPKRDNRKGMDAYTNGYVEGKNEIIDQVTAIITGSKV